MSTYSTTHADMVKEYLLNRSLDKLPTHHSGVQIYATDAVTGADLEGVTLSLNGKTATSDINGMAEIIKVKPGTYNVTVSHAGYAAQSLKIVIERGRVVELEVKMVR